MMEGAKSIYIIGQRRAFPVAAYLAYGLIRLEYRCHLLDSVGGMLPQQVATIGLDDLFVAVSFAEYAQQAVDVVSDAYIRKVTVLAITDSMASPLARNSSLYFEVRDAEVHRFRPPGGTDRAGTIPHHRAGLLPGFAHRGSEKVCRAEERYASFATTQWACGKPSPLLCEFELYVNLRHGCPIT